MIDRILSTIVTVLITLMISWFLFFPWRRDTLEDGGTIVYSSLTYKLYIWNNISGKRDVELVCFPMFAE